MYYIEAYTYSYVYVHIECEKSMKRNTQCLCGYDCVTADSLCVISFYGWAAATVPYTQQLHHTPRTPKHIVIFALDFSKRRIKWVCTRRQLPISSGTKQTHNNNNNNKNVPRKFLGRKKFMIFISNFKWNCLYVDPVRNIVKTAPSANRHMFVGIVI